jgi:hypothetical protein
MPKPTLRVRACCASELRDAAAARANTADLDDDAVDATTPARRAAATFHNLGESEV